MSQALRDDPEKITLAPATGADRFSSKTAIWLFIRDPKRLTTQKQAELELICQRSETARKTYALTQQFMRMLRLRHGQDFETWLSAVEASSIPELGRFAQGLLKDKAAVVAGLTLSYSRSLSSRCASRFSCASPLAHSSKYADYPLFFVVRSKQAHLIWGWAFLIISQHPDAVGKNLEGDSWIVVLTWRGNPKGTRACQEE